MLWKWILALGLLITSTIIGIKIANQYVYLPQSFLPFYESFYFYLVIGILISFFGYWLKNIRNGLRLKRVVREIFGNFSWDSPEWAKATARRGVFKSIGYYLKSKKIWVLSFLLFIGVSGLTFLKYLSEKPRISDKIESVDKTVKVSLDSPNVTSFKKGNQGEILVQTKNLRINFSGNAADLKMRDQIIKKGIALIPHLDGEWKWYGQDSLVFKPKKDWNVGENYIVKIEKSLVADNVILSESELRFTTAPFSGYTTDSELYENPMDPLDKKVVTTFHFSHPVDVDSLKSSINLKLFQKVGDAWSFQKDINFKLIKNEIGMSYSVHSEKLSLAKNSQRVTITVEQSLSSSYANKTLVEKIENQTVIPSIDQFYYFESPNVQLVENNQGEQEQVLHISSSTAIKVEDLVKYIEVFELPLDKRRFYNDVLDIPNSIFQAKKMVTLLPMPTEREFAKEHFFKVSVKQGGQLVVFLKKGLPSFERYELTSDQQYLVKVPNFSSVAKLIPSGNILRLKGDGNASLMMRNVKKASVEIAQVLKNQIHHYLIQNNSDMKEPQFSSYQFKEEHISRKVKKEFILPQNSDANTSHFELINLKQMLRKNFGDSKGRGIFIVKVKKNNNYDVSDSRLIILSDYAMIAKKQSDDSYDVFVYNISTQAPANNVRVEVIGKNGLPLFTRQTNSSGLASFPKLRPSYQDPQPIAFIARKGNNVSFMKVGDYNRQLYYYSSDTGGVYEYGDVANEMRAFVFSDRKMYRPGEKAWFGSIIKDGKWSNNYSGQMIEYEILDPNSRSIYKQKSEIGIYGVNEISYQFTPSDKTGEYSVRANLLSEISEKKARRFLGSTTIKVEEFQPDRIKIQANFKQPKSEGEEKKLVRAWLKPSEVTALGSLRNLFGTPVAGAKIRLETKVQPTSLRFESYPDYRFSHFNQLKKSVSLDRVDFQTDNSGEFSQKIDLDKFANNTFRVLLDIEGFEKEGGRSVKTKLSHLISSHEFLIGVKSESLNFMKEGDKKTILLKAVDSSLLSVNPENLNFQLYKKTPIRTLVKQANGTFKYEKLVKEELLEINPISFVDGSFEIILNTSKVGDFFIEVVDANKTKFARVNYSVVGKSNVQLGEREAQLEIKLSKNDFSHGEFVEVEVKSPFSGAGLITIERDKVYGSKWFKIGGDKKVVKIKVPRNVEGNAYVNVMVIKSTKSPEVLMNPISYQVKNFSINRDKRKLEVTLDHQPLLKPNETLKIKYKSSKKSKIILFGIDEGILQVANYKTPRPLDYFLSKKALSVTSYQTLDMILSDANTVKKFSPGGGKGGALASNLNPFARKALDPVVFWSGLLDASSKEKVFEYKVPDYFNGKMRIIAIAVNEDRVGVDSSFATVRGDFVIMPNVPTFVAPEDQFEVSVILANNLNGEEEMPIKLKAIPSENIEIVGDAEQIKEIMPLRDGVFRYTFKAKDMLGSSIINFEASHDSTKANLKTTLSVRPPVNYQFSIWSGELKKNNFELGFKRKLYSELKSEDAVFSQNPLLAMNSVSEFLTKYPYGCSEQIISKAFASSVIGTLEGSRVSKGQTLSFHENALRVISQRMSYDGLRLYPGSDRKPPFVSLYAYLYILESKKRFLSIPLSVENRVLSQVKKIFNDSEVYLEKAMAAYLLSEDQQKSGIYLSRLQKFIESDNRLNNLNHLGHLFSAATYKVLGREKEALEYLSKYQFMDQQFKDYSFYHTKHLHNTFGLYLMAKHFSNAGSQIDRYVTNVFNNLSGEINSLSLAVSLLALDAYFEERNFTAIPGIEIIKKTFDENKKETEAVIDWDTKKLLSLNLEDAPRGLKLLSSSENPVYFSVSRAGFDKNAGVKELVSGLQITKNIFDGSNSPVTRASQGDEVLVEINVQAKDGKNHQNIVIVELLPGGFEPVLEMSEGSNVDLSAVEYFDRREDRIVFYLSASDATKTIRYRMKAVNKGSYILPGAFAEDMYDVKVRANSKAKRIEIVD